MKSAMMKRRKTFHFVVDLMTKRAKQNLRKSSIIETKTFNFFTTKLLTVALWMKVEKSFLLLYRSPCEILSHVKRRNRFPKIRRKVQTRKQNNESDTLHHIEAAAMVFTLRLTRQCPMSNVCFTSSANEHNSWTRERAGISTWGNNSHDMIAGN